MGPEVLVLNRAWPRFHQLDNIIAGHPSCHSNCTLISKLHLVFVNYSTPSWPITFRPSMTSIPTTSLSSTINQSSSGIFLTMILAMFSPKHFTSLSSTALILLAPLQDSATPVITSVVVQPVSTRALALFPLMVTTTCNNKLSGAFSEKKGWLLAQ